MKILLRLSRTVDAVNARFGRAAEWLVLLASLVSAGNALLRYLFSYSSNGYIEAQWYMFAALVLFGAPYTLRVNEHVRVDVIYSLVSPRTRLLIDAIGIVLFLLPAMFFLTWLTWSQFWVSFEQGESSSQYGGLIRWPVKLVLPIGFGLLALQGLSELVKRLAALSGRVNAETEYHRPVQ